MTSTLQPPSTATRILILAVAILSWFFGGVQIAITNLAMRPAAIDVMDRKGWIDRSQFDELQAKASDQEAPLSDEETATLKSWNALAARWYAWFQCAFLFGAAAGGYLFGRLGDQIGRTRALGISIISFSLFSGLSYFAQDPRILLILRFLACVGYRQSCLPLW